jgi:membrane-associated phospholipid phosphatase
MRIAGILHLLSSLVQTGSMLWGVDVVLWLQSVPGIAPPMLALSALGSPAFYLALVSILAWWGERRFAFRLGLLLSLNAVVNDYAKLLVHEPRPYWVSGDVLVLETQASFGFPSAHAQLAASLMGLVALHLRRPVLGALLGVYAFLIGLSRIAVGVHFPIDVFGGFVIGLVVLGVYVVLEPFAVNIFHRLRPKIRIAIAAALSIGAVAVGTLIAGMIVTWVPDTGWSGPIAGLAPVFIEYTLIAAGFGLGIVLGAELDRGHRSFRSVPDGAIGTMLGLAVLVLFWFVAGGFLPDQGLEAGMGIYVRSAAIGFWCLAGAPFLFRHLRLLEKPDRVQSS